MKKISRICLLAILIMCITNVCLAFDVDMKLDSTKEMKENSEIIYTLTLSEKIIGASFKLDYDNEKLQLVESMTNNLSVAENSGKIACVYFDVNKSAIDTCQIKFKTKQAISNTDLKFTLEEAKFITENGETSYGQNTIQGSSKVIAIGDTSKQEKDSNNNSNNSKNPSNSNGNNNSNNSNNSSSEKENSSQKSEVDSSTANGNLPNTGKNIHLLVAIFGMNMVAIYFFVKMKRI